MHVEEEVMQLRGKVICENVKIEMLLYVGVGQLWIKLCMFNLATEKD